MIGIYIDMKVKYFCPDIFEIDNLRSTPPIRSAGQLVQAYMSVDRTDKFNPFHMLYDPIPKFKNFNKSWEECCMHAARDLWKLGKPIELFWSGGIDSSGALIALLETKSNSDVLNIRYTQDSIDEFPLMWEKMVKDKNGPIPHKKMLDSSLFENHDIIKVTGECGDQCFGSDALHANLDKHADDWESVFTWPNGKLFSVKSDVPKDTQENYKQKKSELARILFEHVDCCPVEIKTIFDLFWWCNFCFKWQDVDSRMIFTFSETSQWGSTISFFNTDDFQKWSIVNHDVKHGGTWKTYKQPAKDYINKYIKDETYRKNKTKEPSLIKILAGATDDKYNYEYRKKRRDNPQAIKLVLNDGRFWRREEKVPDDVYKECLV